MKPFKEIKATPIRDLTAPEHFVIELHYLVRQLRETANRARLHGLQDCYGVALNRAVGRIQGLYYGMHTLLLYGSGATAAEECGELAQAAMNEAEFLTGPYLHH